MFREHVPLNIPQEYSIGILHGSVSKEYSILQTYSTGISTLIIQTMMILQEYSIIILYTETFEMNNSQQHSTSSEYAIEKEIFHGNKKCYWNIMHRNTRIVPQEYTGNYSRNIFNIRISENISLKLLLHNRGLRSIFLLEYSISCTCIQCCDTYIPQDYSTWNSRLFHIGIFHVIPPCKIPLEYSISGIIDIAGIFLKIIPGLFLHQSGYSCTDHHLSLTAAATHAVIINFRIDSLLITNKNRAISRNYGPILILWCH